MPAPSRSPKRTRMEVLNTGLPNACLEVRQNALDLAERVPQVLGDLLGQDVRVGKVGRVLQTLVAQPEQVEAELIARGDLVIGIGAPAPVRCLLRPCRSTFVTSARAIAGDELVEVCPRHRPLLEREVLVGAQVVDPYRFRPGLVAARLA